MIGTMIKIWKVERKLSKIQQDDFEKQKNQVIELQREMKLVLPVTGQKDLFYRINGIHTWLQTKIMLLACMCATAAALFAFISSVMALVTVFSN